MTDTPEELRIIAKDAQLPQSDRQVLNTAADEIEDLQRRLIQTNVMLIESQQRQIATNEQLIAARKEAPKPLTPIWTTLFSGPLKFDTWVMKGW